MKYTKSVYFTSLFIVGFILIFTPNGICDIKNGKTIYEQACMDCHGKEGKGILAPHFLKVTVLNLRMASLHQLTTLCRPQAPTTVQATMQKMFQHTVQKSSSSRSPQKQLTLLMPQMQPAENFCLTRPVLSVTTLMVKAILPGQLSAAHYLKQTRMLLNLLMG